jgi:hypothetical protein
VDDAYEFYPCLVDGAPASIYLNMRFEHDPQPQATTAYWLAVRFNDRGEHGVGTAAEAELLNAFEESAIERLAAVGLVYAGRVRTSGMWETTFYGPPGHVDDVRAVTQSLADHRAEVRSAPDVAWSYYRDFLLPDAERRQWIDDRRLVQVLAEQGDRLTTPRRVDHWASFDSEHARDAFIAAVEVHGFIADRAEAEGRFEASVHRVDPIELDHIHDVVMLVLDAAEAQGGTYDGWETGIESG